MIYRVWMLIKNIKRKKSKILLDGFVKIHRLKFSQILRDIEKKERGKEGERKDAKGDSVSPDDGGGLSFHQYNRLIYELIMKGVQQFPKSHRLRLLLANFQYHKMGVFWSPIAQLRSIFEQKPFTSHWFSAIQLQIVIEKELNLRENVDKASTAVDIKHILEYDKVYHKFLERVAFAAEKNLEFWTELSTKDPDSNKLLDLGSSLLVINERVKKSFLKLIEYKVALSNLYQIFAGFVRFVTHDQDLNLEILERANNLRRRKSESGFEISQKLNLSSKEERLTNNEENIAVLQVSGNRDDFGNILGVSNSIWSLLG